MSILNIIILALSLSSCDSSQQNDSTRNIEGWHFEDKKSFILNLAEAKKNLDLVDKLISDFSSNPYEKSYNQISIWKVFRDNTSATTYYVFDINYVDDIYAVYVINEKTAIVDKFLLSAFSNR